MKKLITVSALALLTSLFSNAHAADQWRRDDQQSLTIYQMMVASFMRGEDGTPRYTAMWGPDGERTDGNLRGIINSLDHIKSLGANAIWMTPIFDSSEAYGGEKLRTTGYFTNNFFKIDPHFGTEADLRELIDEAHKRDMYVLLDGVFGHHGGVTAPSPQGHYIDTTRTLNDRDLLPGNVAYPGSLPYFKDVATYWIDNYGIDGWRMDQAYQLLQGGHNYWNEIRDTIETVCRRRAAAGEEWGTLGYVVGEDWGNADVVNGGVYKDGGLISAFDFEGKERISGSMQKLDGEGLANGWDDVIWMLQSPRQRGYVNDTVMPNLFLTNHDGYRLADHFDPADKHYYEKQMARFAILAAYNGPVTMYYGDEYADTSRGMTGGAPDNIGRTTGHLEPRTDGERQLRDYVADVMHKRRANPAMWRGKSSFTKTKVADADVLIVDKIDETTGNQVLIVFSDQDTTVPVHGYGPVDVDAWRPEVIVVKEPKM